jgi:hypothetical protein
VLTSSAVVDWVYLARLALSATQHYSAACWQGAGAGGSDWRADGAVVCGTAADKLADAAETWARRVSGGAGRMSRVQLVD